VRKKGSTDNDVTNSKVLAYGHIYAVIGVDSNRIFQAYIANTNCKVYLLGYTDENVVLRDNEQSLSLGGSSTWTDVDVSSYVPAGATGVILRVTIAYDSDSWLMGFRKKGSTWNTRFRWGYRRHSWVLVGVDANRVYQSWYEDGSASAYWKVYLVGYTKSPVTFFTNPIDKSISTTGAWTDIDVTSETEASADGILVWILYNGTSSTNYKGGIRKNGSTNDDNANMKIRGSEWSDKGAHITGFCGLDADNIFEGYIENAVIDFYLIGYCKPAIVPQTKNWSILLNTAHVLNCPYRTIKLTQALSNIHVFSRPLRHLQLSQALNVTHAFFRHRLMKLTQGLHVLHAWAVTYPGLVLKQWFAMLNAIHTFKRPYRQMRLTQTLQTVHALVLQRFFKIVQALNLFHVFHRPERKIGYAQALEMVHVFGRPVRVIKFPAPLQLTHLFSRPFRFIRMLQQLRLVHLYYVAVPSVKKTKLFLVVGDLAIQLSND
jgi:hypothetical protein